MTTSLSSIQHPASSIQYPIAAIARDYAVGIATSAHEAGTPAAKAWLQTQWWPDIVQLLVYQAHWWIAASVGFSLGPRWWRKQN